LHRAAEAHPDLHRYLDSLLAQINQILIERDPAILERHDDGRPSELKVPELISLLNRCPRLLPLGVNPNERQPKQKSSVMGPNK
jgi:hypothetical protein